MVPKMVNSKFIVPAPVQVRTSQLKLQSALRVRNNRHKVRHNAFWFTHRPQECAATSLVRIRPPSLRTRDIVTVDTNHKAFSSEQGVTIANVPGPSHRSCATEEAPLGARRRNHSATGSRHRPQFGRWLHPSRSTAGRDFSTFLRIATRHLSSNSFVYTAPK